MKKKTFGGKNTSGKASTIISLPKVRNAATGGGASPMASPPMASPPMADSSMAGAPGMKKGGSAQKKGTDMKKMASGGSAKKMASGGSFRSSADGIASKGKTKAKQVKMARGGSMKGCS